MKKRYLFSILLLFLTFILCSCGISVKNSTGGDSTAPIAEYDSSGIEKYIDGFKLPDGIISSDALGDSPLFYRIDVHSAIGSPMSSEEKAQQIFNPAPGQLSSSALKDHEHFTEWLNSITKEDSKLTNLYNDFTNLTQSLYADQMITIKVLSNNVPVENVKVSLLINGNVCFKTITDAFGLAYLFADFKSMDKLVIAFDYDEPIVLEFDVPVDNYLEVNLNDLVIKNEPKTLDLALIVDTTGSMGDEILYLKSELRDVLDRVEQLNVNINLALIFYRDYGDAYVTKVFDFTDDLETQYDNLSKQNAYGGGDTPEAIHEALLEARNLNWGENSTKLLIHVCDAPIHNLEDHAKSFSESVLELTKIGVKMIPVICSGHDYFCELIFRLAALYTGGTYTYITNDSGIGNDHLDPETDVQLVVEYLNKMLERLIKEYVTGEKIDPEPYYIDNAYCIALKLTINGEEKTNLYFVYIQDSVSIKELLNEFDVKTGDVLLLSEDTEEIIDVDTIIQSNLVLKLLKPIIVDEIPEVKEKLEEE